MQPFGTAPAVAEAVRPPESPSLSAGARATSAVRHAVTLFHLGLVLAAAHVAVSLETAVTLSSHGALTKSVLLLLYPVALALLGCGAAIDRLVLRSEDPRPPLRAAGLALLAFLLLSFRWNFLAGEGPPLRAAALAHVVPLSAWFLCAGVALARILRAARGLGPSRMAGIWAVHQLGLVAGYLVQDAAVPLVGANALLLLLGLSLLPPSAPGIGLLVVGAVAAPALGLDARIESFRSLRGLAAVEGWWREHTGDGVAAIRGVAAGEDRTVHLGWSRFGQFRLVIRSQDPLAYTGWYNFTPQWDLDTADRGRLAAFRRRLYALLADTERAVVIGVGGGRGLLALPEARPEGLVAIERDPAVVRYLSRDAPHLNERIFSEVATVAEDGRRFVARSATPFDAIIVESARYQPASNLFPASAPFYLYTREALAEFVRALSPDGLFVMGFSQVRHRAAFAYLPARVQATLQDLGVHTRAIELREGDVHVLACRSLACTERVDAGRVYWRTRPWQPPAHFRVDRLAPLTDERPFVSWILMEGATRRGLQAATGAVGLLALAAAAALARASRARAGWDPVPYFFAVGFANAALVLATFYGFRTFYRDELLTVVRVLAWLIAFGAVGSALSHRIAPRLGRAAVRIGVPALALGLHVAAWRLLPFHEPSPILREIAGALALLPGGFVMGVFFPAGWLRASADRTGILLMADALGTLAGYLALYGLLLPFGVTAYAAAAVVAYLAAAALWRPGGSAT